MIERALALASGRKEYSSAPASYADSLQSMALSLAVIANIMARNEEMAMYQAVRQETKDDQEPIF